VEDRILGLENKIGMYEKQKNPLAKESRAAKAISKNSETSSKDQTCKSWALKKEKRSKLKVYAIYSKKQ
jgi:hypothetical protein